MTEETLHVLWPSTLKTTQSYLEPQRVDSSDLINDGMV